MFSLLTKHRMPCTMPLATRSVRLVSRLRSRLRKPVSMMAVMVFGSISEKAWYSRHIAGDAAGVKVSCR